MVMRRFGLPSVSAFSSLFLRTFPPAMVLLLLLPAVLAQQASPPPSGPSLPGGREQGQTSITVPAGTRLALVLTHLLDSKTARPGDELYAQTTAPVTVYSQTAIPAGTFLQGQVEKLTRRGSRGKFLMRSVSLVFPNGYVAPVAGPMDIESDEDTAWRDPSGGAKAAAMVAPAAGLGLGALIGSAAHTMQHSSLGGMTLTSATPSGLAIGSMVGLAAGGVVSLVLLTRSPHFYVDVGSPMEMILPSALILPLDRLSKAGPAQSPAPLVTPPAPRPIFVPADNGICTTAGTPGTPPIVIPGSPPVGNSPGTPDVVLPGTPAIPGASYPCPWP